MQTRRLPSFLPNMEEHIQCLRKTRLFFASSLSDQGPSLRLKCLSRFDFRRDDQYSTDSAVGNLKSKIF